VQCRGEDRALFFVALGADAAKARALCSICPVREECLAYALADPESAVLVGRHLGAGAAETGPLGGVGTEPRVRSPSAPKRPGVRSPA
jgi:adenine-specific DNA glycosylase